MAATDRNAHILWHRRFEEVFMQHIQASASPVALVCTAMTLTYRIAADLRQNRRWIREGSKREGYFADKLSAQSSSGAGNADRLIRPCESDVRILLPALLHSHVRGLNHCAV